MDEDLNPAMIVNVIPLAHRVHCMDPRFIFVVCQNGAESACKLEILNNHPGLKLSFSRPGFLTFKDESNSLPEQFHLKSTFARSYGWSIGNNKSEDLKAQLDLVLQNSEAISGWEQLHVWQRDTRIPGTSGFEPGCSVLAEQVGNALVNEIESNLQKSISANRVAKSDQKVFDVILLEPDYWFWGYHIAGTRFQRWPGGTPKIDSDYEVISRAYYKLHEALLWSGIQINEGDVCCEIGSSPGGACQLLLGKNAKVIAVDPADLEEGIAAHPNLTYLKCRGKEVRKKQLKDVRWLLSDVNVAPNYTLDTIEEIVSNQSVTKIRGLILTLKLSEFSLASEIPNWIDRVKSWGFQLVKTRQLAFNRREICLVAIRDQFALRSSRRK